MFGQGEVGEVLEEHGEQAKLAEGLANSALALSHYQSSTGEGGVWGCGGCATTRAARVRGDCGGVGVAGSWVGEGCVWGGCGGLGGCFALSHYQRPRAVHPPTRPPTLLAHPPDAEEVDLNLIFELLSYICEEGKFKVGAGV